MFTLNLLALYLLLG